VKAVNIEPDRIGTDGWLVTRLSEADGNDRLVSQVGFRRSLGLAVFLDLTGLATRFVPTAKDSASINVSVLSSIMFKPGEVAPGM
jgi:hypothetical protein